MSNPGVNAGAVDAAGNGVGKCFCLGYSSEEIWPGIQDIFNATDIGLDNDIVETAKRVVRETGGEFYLLDGSRWHAALTDLVDTGEIAVVDRLSACGLLLERKKYIFFDDEEFECGLGEELRNTFFNYPLGVVTAKNVECARQHWEYFVELAERLENEMREIGKKMWLFGRDKGVYQLPDFFATVFRVCRHNIFSHRHTHLI